MSRQIIAVDIDDVLADNAEGFIAFTNQQWGMNLTSENYNEGWYSVWGVGREEGLRRAELFHASGTVGRYTHNDAALPVLQYLSGQYDLIIITSRRVVIRQETVEWIHAHYPGIFRDESIHFAGIWDGPYDKQRINRTKADLCRDLHVNYLIDDQLKHCTAAAKHGIGALLYGNYTWNAADQLDDNVTRVDSWAEVKEFFDAQRSR